ncbi:MAG TPA: DUF6325 family protein [Actinomycetota bacterium]
MDEFGPVQILVVGFEGTSFNGEIMPELQRLKELDIIRLVDMAVVSKDTDGEVVGVELSDLSDDQRAEFGAIAGALIGLGYEPDEEGVEAGALAGAEAAEDGLLEDSMWSIADTIPEGTTAAVALIEHRWAIPLRDAIRRNGGVPLADSWIHPEDLVAIGAAAAANED